MSPLRHTTVVGWVLALAALVGSLPAAADDVLLHNGNSFDGVIVVAENEETVRIRLAYGEMSLPRSWIARIDRTETPLASYLERRREILARPDAGADDWLALARWSRARELAHGYKESLLEAALLAPRHPDLVPLLRALGYVLEEPAGVWVSAAERRRAAAAEEARQRAAAAEARRADANLREELDPETERTLSRAVEALALAELERETRQSEREARGERTYYPVRVGGYGLPLYPVTYLPGLVLPTAPAAADPAPGAGDPGPAAAPAPDPYRSVRSRLAGSLLTERPAGRVNGRSRPHLPGSLLSGRRR